MGSTVAALTMVLAAGASLSCAVAGRPRHPGRIGSAMIMFVAMVDMAIGHVLLSALGWAMLLITLAVIVVALPRVADDRCSWQHCLALVATALIMLGSPHTLPTARAEALVHGGHAASAVPVDASWLFGLMITAGYVAAAAMPSPNRTARTTTGQRSGPGRAQQVAQVVTTAGCLAAMSLLPTLT